MAQRDHLVADEHDTGPVGLFTQHREKFRCRRNDPAGTKDRLDDDGGEFVAVGRDGLAYSLGVVIAHEHDVGGRRRRQPAQIGCRYTDFHRVVRLRHGVTARP